MENTVIAQEVMYKMKKHKGKKGLMMMKLDLKKAYDRIEWSFLRKVLKGWGFDEKVQNMIYSCVNSVELSLLLKGNMVGNFRLERRLRQGDPLSHLLFILCSEVLSILIEQEERRGKMHGIKISRSAPTITHLMYADDLLVMGRANKSEAESFMHCFDATASGSVKKLILRNLIFCSLNSRIGKTKKGCWIVLVLRKWEQPQFT